ncbi:glycosyltransferase family A protein [Acinetobacter wuhouensis]|uniref:Glycosyltransferase family 2 protein n=1 Tax=Acinetobacter wuhouensis TaxID=1879050 RepID=A0A4V2DNJ3_9GAMM|nr:glycosyltransferase family A protein [Acinetobacter wuhouensis]RZG49136.1 glycosyltransferase family 2 protein [Acinetobacter wuhouensis]
MVFVSVIIPSAGRRPELLHRAIKSALVDDEQIKTEIIVVLNGRDGMDFDTSQSFQHRLVTYYKIEQGSVSKARNYGLSVAQGELIRFLDDDDFLIPDMAYQQYTELYHSNAELSTYAGAIEDDQTRYQVIVPINTDDYYSAVMSANCPSLTFASVYKKKIVGIVRWNEESHIAEDEEWMRKLSYVGELKWIRNTLCVGVWFQHQHSRLSFKLGHPLYYKNRAESISELVEYLASKNDLTLSRKKYAAQGLWSAIHGGFHFSPIYWSRKIIQVRELDKGSMPDIKIFQHTAFIHPLFMEWLLIPLRWGSRIIKSLLINFNKKSYIRRPRLPTNDESFD